MWFSDGSLVAGGPAEGADGLLKCPSKIGEKLAKAHDQKKVLRLPAWPEGKERLLSVTAGKAGHGSACPCEAPQHLQWVFDFRLNRAPV